MGSLISRRRRAVRVEAKSIATQATEGGITELEFETTENPAEVAATVKRQMAAVAELNIGDGLVADRENHQHQITSIQKLAANANRKRKVRLSMVKIRPRPGKKILTHGKDCSTQYDFLSVPGQVLQPVEDSNVERPKSPSSHRNIDDNKAPLTAAADEVSSRLEKSETWKRAVDEASQSCSDIPFIDETEDIGDEGEDNVSSTTLEKSRKLQSLHPQHNTPESIYMPPSVPQKKTEYTFDCDPEADLPKVNVNDERGLEPKVDSLEELFQKNVPCGVELLEVAAVTGTGSKQEPLPPSAGYQASCNQQTSTEGAEKRKLHKETDSTVVQSSWLVGSQAKSASGPKSSKNDDKNTDRCQEDFIVEGKNYNDGCQDEDEDMAEDTLDWNVDDRVRSPSDPGKEDDNDNDSCHEVIPEGDNNENDECKEDVIVKAYNNDDGGFQESDMAEDTLDINVDDRVHSPSDPRSDHESSEGEDNMLDVLMDCTTTGEFVMVGQRQNSLTTLKDGDSAEGSIYSSLSKLSPPKASALAETKNTVSKEVAYVKQTRWQQQEEQHPLIEPVKVTQTGTDPVQVDTRMVHGLDTLSCTLEHRDQVLSAEAYSVGDGSLNRSLTCIVPSHIQYNVPQDLSLHAMTDREQRLQLETGQTEDLPKESNPNMTLSDDKDHVPLKETVNNSNLSEDITETQRYEDKRGKLLTNLGDTLSFDVGESPKSLLEMQEAEAITLLLLAGTLPGENSGDVIKGAGDAHSLDVHGANMSEESLQDTSERAGLAAMLDDLPKSSCQLEQLRVEQTENHHNSASHVQLPPNRQASENDSSAACAPATYRPQDSIHVIAEVDPESNGSSTPGNIPGIRDNNLHPSQHATHGAAAASFVEESIEDGLSSPKRSTSPAAAAASEGDWEMIPLHQVTGQTNLGGLAACASSSCPKVYNCLQEMPADVQHSHVETDIEPSTLVIEVQATATTEAMAQPLSDQSLSDQSLDQQDETVQSLNTFSGEHSEQLYLFSGHSDVFRANETESGTTVEVSTPGESKANIEEPNKTQGTANSARQRRTVDTVQLQASSTNNKADQSQIANTQSTESSTLKVNPNSSQNDDKANQE